MIRNKPTEGPLWMHESTEMFQLLSQAEEDEQQHRLQGGVSLSHKLLRAPLGFIFKSTFPFTPRFSQQNFPSRFV